MTQDISKALAAARRNGLYDQEQADRVAEHHQALQKRMVVLQIEADFKRLMTTLHSTDVPRAEKALKTLNDITLGDDST